MLMTHPEPLKTDFVIYYYQLSDHKLLRMRAKEWI
jgi:hypothetical protein